MTSRATLLANWVHDLRKGDLMWLPEAGLLRGGSDLWQGSLLLLGLRSSQESMPPDGSKKSCCGKDRPCSQFPGNLLTSTTCCE